MRFFNLDLHISVIADIQDVFGEIGHQVDSWSISGHNWVFDRPSANVDIVNASTWRNLSPDMCNAFYERYKDDLAGYDGFVVTYPPTFAWLFARWNKPIIVVCPIRYEYPFTGQPLLWAMFNDYIREGIDRGQIIAIGNSVYDAKYAEWFTDREWQHIPSLSRYTKVSWTGEKSKYLFSSRMPLPGISRIVNKSIELQSGYRWDDLVKYRGIVYVPYNVSTMSMFENYSQCMPMFFPTLEFMEILRDQRPTEVLSEISWSQVLKLPPKSFIRTGKDDPNRFDDVANVMRWAKWADFYDMDWMPHLNYFDSWEELEAMLARFDSLDRLKACSELMRVAGKRRAEKVINLWQKRLTDIV